MKKLLMMIGAAAAVGAMLTLSAMADAVRVYDVDDYVTDGLVLHFDGIRNVGATADHVSSATTWANLVLGQPSASFVRADASYGEWRDSGFYFEGRDKPCGAWLDEAVSLGPNMTIQIAVSVDPLAQQSVDTNKRYPAYFYGPSPDFGIYQGSYSGAASVPKQLTFKKSLTYSSGDSNTKIAEWDGMYASAILGDDSAYLTQSGGFENGVSRTPGKAASQRYSWGCGVDVNGNCNIDRAVIGTFHSVRVYGRALSESELAQNRAVDEARYRNEASKGKGNDDVNVVVASNVDGIEGTEESGKWSITGGTHTFTAPTTRVVEFKVYSLNGYTIETWNGTSWDEAVSHVGASYTASTSDPKVRLTWLWTQTPLTTADVSDYVQDGIVLHFDGIRNVGATADHESSATTWANLGTLGTTHNATKTSAQSYPSGAADGEWCADGYQFNGKDYFAIGESVNLGGAATVELFVNYVTDDAISKYPVFFGDTSASDGFVVYTTNGGNPYFKQNNANSKSDSDWQEPYIIAIFDKENSQTSIGDDIPPVWNTGLTLSNLGSAWKYAIGTAGTTDARKKDRMLVGTVKSVRVYNRILQDTDLELNRAIDEVRFNGNLTVVNGAIGETGENGKCSLPSGVYSLDNGTWTITAESVKVEGDGNYWPKLLVETWDEATGEWVADTTRPVWTESYTIDKAALGDSRIRLTWTWGKRIGLIISIY